MFKSFSFYRIFLISIILIGILSIYSSCNKEISASASDIIALKTAVADLQKRSDSLANALKNTNSSISILGKSVDSIRIQLVQITSQITQLNAQLTSSNANIVSINLQIADLNKQYLELLAKLNNLINDFTNTTQFLNSRIDTLSNSIKTLQKRSDSLAAALSSTNSVLLNYSKTVDTIKIQLAFIVSQINQLNTQMTQVNANIPLINSQITLLNQQYADLLARLNALIAQLNGPLNQWTSLASIPIPIANFNVIAIGNLIYLIGGGESSVITNKIQVYNITNNSWSTVASMPTARGEQGSAIVNGIIYVIGGYNSRALNVVEAYNPATNTWSTKAPMPTARSQFSVAVVNNKIYAMGGWPGNINVLEEFDPITNSWSTKARLLGLQQVNGAIGNTTNSKLYLIGGKDANVTTFYNNTQCYDTKLNSWSEKSPYPFKVYGGSTALDTSLGLIHYVGGVSIPNYSNPYFTGQVNSHYIYDINNDKWTASIPLPVTLAGHSSVFVNGKLYVFGGFDPNGVLQNAVYRYY